MANSNTFKMLKSVIYSLYDNNGNERPSYIGIIKDNDVNEVRIDLLKNIIKVCLESDWFSEETKLYLRNRDLTLKRVNEVINEQLEENRNQYMAKYGLSLNDNGKVKYNNTVSKIMYDQKKLNSKFGGDFMTNIVVQKTVDISHYEMIVNKMLIDSLGVDSSRDNLTLNIREGLMIKEYDGDFIDKYGDILRFYLKSTIKSIEEMLNKDKLFVGYFNYLLSGISTSDNKVIEDRKKLINILNLDMSELFINKLLGGIKVENLINKNTIEIEEDFIKENDSNNGDSEVIEVVLDDDIDIDNDTIEVEIIEDDTDDIESETIYNVDNDTTMGFDKFNIVHQGMKLEEREKIDIENTTIKDTSEKKEAPEVSVTDTIIEDNVESIFDNFFDNGELDFDSEEDDFVDLEKEEGVKEKIVEIQLEKKEKSTVKKEEKPEPIKLKTNRIQF